MSCLIDSLVSCLIDSLVSCLIDSLVSALFDIRCKGQSSSNNIGKVNIVGVTTHLKICKWNAVVYCVVIRIVSIVDFNCGIAR